MELNQQAEYLERKMGTRPESWYEFKLKNHTEIKTNPAGSALFGALVGAGIGLAILGAVALVAGVALSGLMALPILQVGLLGAAIGGSLGWGAEIQRENDANTKLVNDYKSYLGGYAQSQEHCKEQALGAVVNCRDDHAQKIIQERNQTPQQVRG